MKIKLLKYDLFNLNTVDREILVFRISHLRKQYPDPENCRNCRDFFKVALVEQGRACMHCGSGKIFLEPGMIYLVHPDDLTSYEITEEPFTVCNVLFRKTGIPLLVSYRDGEGLFTIFRDDFVPSPDGSHVLAVSAGRECGSAVMRLLKEQQIPGMESRLFKQMLLQELLILISRSCGKKRPSVRADRIVSFLLKKIETDFRKGVDVSEAARALSVTKNHLCTVFRKVTGKTVTEKVIERRLAEAEILLGNPALSISEAAYCCGFNDLSYFYRVFKHRYGMNPGARRKILSES